MPKPYLLTRPSGLYVRFRVPRDLVPRLGFGSIVRSLHGLRGDAARLSAALQAVALSDAFARLRKGAGMSDVDVKKLPEPEAPAIPGAIHIRLPPASFLSPAARPRARYPCSFPIETASRLHARRLGAGNCGCGKCRIARRTTLEKVRAIRKRIHFKR